jgi:uncharacterized oligopeptide transporter (OPT) family protein
LEQDNLKKTPEEREKEWFEKVYRGGKEEEITFRALFLGLLIGSVLSLSNLYVGFKTGWSLGVTITAAIMSFALFKSLRKVLPFIFKKDMGLLEINILQTTASACAFIASAGLVSAVPALLMVSGKSLPNLHLVFWVMAILYLGLFMAIPMKRQMINVEDLKFPTGFATSEVLMGMYAKGDDALKKARALFAALGIGVVIAWLRDGIIGFPTLVKGHILKENGIWQWKRLLPSIPATFVPSSMAIFGIPLVRLTLTFEGSLIMVGAGAIMGIRAGASLLFGALLGYGILSPMAIKNGDIVHTPPAIQAAYSLKDSPRVVCGTDLVLPQTIEKGSELAISITEEGSAPKLLAKKWDGEKSFKNKKELVAYLNSREFAPGEANPFFDDIEFTYDSAVNRLAAGLKKNPAKTARIEVLKSDNIPFGFSAGASDTALRYPIVFPATSNLSFIAGTAGGPSGPIKEETVGLMFYKDVRIESEKNLLALLNEKELPWGGLNPFSEKIVFSVAKGRLSARAAKLTQWDSLIRSGSGAANSLLGFSEGQQRQENYGGFRNIVKWLMWPGVAMMVAAGLLSFFLQWRTVLRAFKGLSDLVKGTKSSSDDGVSKVEIPASWFLFGFIGVGIGAVVLQVMYFGITWWMGSLAVIMTFFLAIVACRATGETDITPVGAMGKITQLMYGAIAPGNMVANLMTANVTGGAATSSADLLQSLKCGYRIGASPRKQFLAMVLGVIGGAIICVPVYNILIPNADVIGTDKLPAPAAQTWAGVAILLSKGLSALPISARWGLLWGAIFGIAITLVERNFPKMRNYLPSPTAMGIAFVIPAFNSISMFAGALIAYILEKKAPQMAENYTVPVASGVIAGESIMGILVAILIAFQFL